MNKVYKSFSMMQLLQKVGYNFTDRVCIPYGLSWLNSITKLMEPSLFPIRSLFDFSSSTFFSVFLATPHYDSAEHLRHCSGILKKKKTRETQQNWEQNWMWYLYSSFFTHANAHVNKKIVIVWRGIWTLWRDVFRIDSPMIPKKNWIKRIFILLF